MSITRPYLHSLLRDYKFDEIDPKSKIRQCLEELRGNVSDSENFYSPLTDAELKKLIFAIKAHIEEKNCFDMKLLDNKMIHKFMIDSLLTYELNYPTRNDAFREMTYLYFYTLGKHHSFSQSNALHIWLNHVIENPDLYIRQRFVTGLCNECSFPQLKLAECGCSDISHDRLFGDVRIEVERMVLDECLRIMVLDECSRMLDECSHIKESSTIKVLSLGPGKGLQDFIIILKLFMRGIKNIELTLIEKNYDMLLAPNKESVQQIWQKDWSEEKPLPAKYLNSYQEDIYAIVRALTVLSRCFTDAHLIIKQYPSVACLAEEKRRQTFDVIYAIDFEDYAKDNTENKSTSDFNALANYLSKDGSAIISSHNQIEKYEVEESKSNKSFFPVYSKEFKKVAPINELNNYQQKHNMKSFFKE
jgi:hypothetical protein